MVKLLTIKKSTRKDKKLMATFDNGIITHFGATGYNDYTITNDDERKRLYLIRHGAEDWTNPTKASTLSRYILWNKKTLEESIKDYKTKFKI
jgi:hypothetical protein